MRWGVMRVLTLGAALSAASNLLFAWLCTRGHDVTGLTLVVSADNLAGGIASAAFIAYLSSLTNVQYSATQYALFSSMMLLAPQVAGGLFRPVCRCLWLRNLFCGHGLFGRAGAAAGGAGGAGAAALSCKKGAASVCEIRLSHRKAAENKV